MRQAITIIEMGDRSDRKPGAEDRGPPLKRALPEQQARNAARNEQHHPFGGYREVTWRLQGGYGEVTVRLH